jgi:predicted transcriptional regulator
VEQQNVRDAKKHLILAFCYRVSSTARFISDCAKCVNCVCTERIGMPKNITISISDELATKMDSMPEINWSEVCRQAITNYIEEKEPKQKGELIEGLENYLSGKLPLTEDKEKIRREEIERFTKKWGNPDSVSSDEEISHNYVTLLKTQKSKLGNTFVELEISNSRLKKESGKYDINLYDKNLEPLIEYFKSKGFTIAEENLLQSGVMHHVLKTYGSKGREEWRQLASRGYQYFGLFALDKEDCVFIAYREVKPK